MTTNLRPSTITPGSGRDEVQELKVAATGGEVLVEGEGKFAAFPWDASSAVVQAKLEGLFGSGNVTVTGGPGDATGSSPYRLTFQGALSEDSQAPVTNPTLSREAEAHSLGANLQGEASVTVATTPSPDATIVVQAVNLGNAAASGLIKLSDVVPAGMTVQGASFFAFSKQVGKRDLSAADCSLTKQQVTCATEPTAGAYEAFILKVFTELGFNHPPFNEPPTREIILHSLEEAHPQPEFDEQFAVGPIEPYENLELRVAVTDRGAASGETNTAEVKGGPAAPATSRHPVPVGTEPPSFGPEEFSVVPEEEGGGVDTQAASHPYQVTTTVALNQTADTLKPPALARNLHFDLPPGLIGNATLLPQCSDLDFRHVNIGGFEDNCPADTVVGVATVTIHEPLSVGLATWSVPLFNLIPEKGEPARLGFEAASAPVQIDTAVRTGSDYGIRASVNNITELANFISSTVTIWGVPGDKSHDSARGWSCLDAGHWTAEAKSNRPCLPTSDTHPAPFWTMPSSCRQPFTATVDGESWPTYNPPASPTHPEALSFPTTPYNLADVFGRSLSVSGCNRLPFSPFVESQPDVTAASTPTGLATTVRVPQEVSLGAQGLASSSVRDISVRFPEGVTVNPASADGLQACPEEQVGFTGFAELDPSGEPGANTAQFTPTIGSPFCPDASKIGTVVIKVPVIAHPLEGSLYLATQDTNPFHTLLAAYIVAEDPESGVLVKLPGEISLNPVTGQMTATFENSPDAPLESAEIHLFGGDRAPLSTPTHCGTYTTEATFTPWSGTAPVTSQSQFRITTGVNGTPCPPAALPFTPSLTAGSPNVSAGAFSPLVTTIGREDGQQNINRVQLHFAPGMSGILAGVPLCHEAEANAGTCPESSLIGSTIVSVGLGGDPFSVTGGKVYLTERIAGSTGDTPFGLSIVNPAKAGPFDLGKVIVRATIEVDPRTAALTVTTAEIPHILDGIPLQIKHVNVTIDRPGFTFNPTSCNPLSITGTIGAVEGATAPVSDPFQVTNCAALKFTPTVAVSTAGKASRSNGASLHFKIAYPKGALGTQSWFNEARFTLPRQLPAELRTIQKSCDHKIFEGNRAACPAGSKIGSAVVHTPVLPVPLTGPVYFVSYGNAQFPEAVLVLDGYGVHIELHGETDIAEKTGVTTATFRNTPDVPFESIEVTLPQGPFSEFGANLPHEGHDFCGQKMVMPTFFKASNGAEIHQNTPVGVTGCSTKIAVSSHRLKGRNLTLTVYVPAAGKLRAGGRGLSTASKTAKSTETLTLTLHANRKGKFKTKVRLTFTPAKGAKQAKALSIHV